MKKFLTLLFIFIFSLMGCGSSSNPEIKESKLTNITLSGDYQTEFYVNDTFSYDGLIVTAKYSDGKTKEVTNYTVSTPDISVIGSKNVVVSYSEQDISKIASYQIKVLEKVEPPSDISLTSISLSGSYQTEFEVGDTFNYDGLIVTAHYSDDSSKEVTNFTISSPNMNISGIKVVTVSYSEKEVTKSVSYEITVKEKTGEDKTLSSIYITGTFQTEFEVGDSFSYTGLKVYAMYSDDTTKEVINYTVSAPDMTTSGTKTITVSYTEKNITRTITYNIVVKDKVLESVFNEPYLGKQVYLNHIGDIYSVWQRYRGKGITIAVIDKAFDPYHEDFTKLDGTSKISSKSASFSYNGNKVTTNVGVSYTYDLSDSHGTFCAGVAGAALNHKGVIGVAPDADLMLLKTDGKPKSIVEAFKYAADNGARVVTISIGSYYNYDGDLINDGSDLSTVFNDATKYCVDKGVVVCSAAGNGGYDQPNEYTFPGASENVIGCGGLAFNESDEIWEGSSYNSSKTYQFVDVFAPADNMFNICNYQDNGRQVLYDGGWQGTSFSSPIVAGLAALYFEKYPDKTAREFESALYNSCHKMSWSSIAREDQLGYGRVDVARLLNESSSGNVTVKLKTNWSSVRLYAYNSDLTLQKELKVWPGVNMSKNNGYFIYNLNIDDYDSLLFSLDDNNKTVNILSSSFINNAVYDIATGDKMSNLYVGQYTQS